MARELKGYARKRAMGLVPHRYDARGLRGVQPPVRAEEARAYERAAWHKAGKVAPFDRPGAHA